MQECLICTHLGPEGKRKFFQLEASKLQPIHTFSSRLPKLREALGWSNRSLLTDTGHRGMNKKSYFMQQPWWWIDRFSHKAQSPNRMRKLDIFKTSAASAAAAAKHNVTRADRLACERSEVKNTRKVKPRGMAHFIAGSSEGRKAVCNCRFQSFGQCVRSSVVHVAVSVQLTKLLIFTRLFILTFPKILSAN